MDIEYVAELCLTGRSKNVMEAVCAHPELLKSLTKEFGYSLLYLAVVTGNMELVSSMLLVGADPNDSQSSHDSPLIKAIELESPDRLEIVRLLIKHGANVNAPGVSAKSALHRAVARSCADIVELLLINGADINIHLDADQCTPLWCASLWEREDMVRLLLKHGADVNLKCATTGSTPLDMAIRKGNMAIISSLIDTGANPNLRGEARNPPLITAILSNPPRVFEIVQLLLQHGATINATGEYWASPLHAAVEESPIELIEFLLKNGADVNHRSQMNGMTPLMIATDRKNTSIINLLLAYGSDPHIQDNDGKTALDIAQTFSQETSEEIIQILLGKSQ